MNPHREVDLVIIGAGIGGVICLHYARKAGLNAVVLEKEPVTGGLWAQLPAWQDIQIKPVDWTLGDLPIDGADQPGILKNIRAWVDKFDLASGIELNTPVTRAERQGERWTVTTPGQTWLARHLVSATGAHNRPMVPPVLREVRAGGTLRELHSSALRDPAELAGKDVVVVGAGASGFDLLDLCFEHKARKVTWVYRSVHWMVPTRKPKSVAGDIRGLAKQQMLGATVDQINQALNADLRGRYQKFGLMEILPDYPFDLGLHQLIPGRFRMLEHFGEIERHKGEVVRIAGNEVHLSSGTTLQADTLLWGTGYDADLRYFASPALSGIKRLQQVAQRCACIFQYLDQPNLYFLATILEGTGSGPWAYSIGCRSIVAHMRGKATFESVPTGTKIAHFDFLPYFAARDPESFPPGQWRAHYEKLALSWPEDVPLPIP